MTNPSVRRLMSKSEILNITSTKKLLELCKFPMTAKLKLVYRASLHGFTALAFHKKCDHLQKVVILIKSDSSNIFGGYSSKGWDSSFKGYTNDPNAFLFSLVNKDHAPCIMKCTMPEFAIYNDHDSGIIFGAGMDLFIKSSSDQNWESTSQLGYSYKHPFYLDHSEEAKSFLAGSHYFQTQEIEVFKVE